MKIVSYNINGVRSAAKRGLLEWINIFDADCYGFQEVRADENIVKNIIYGDGRQYDMFSKSEVSNLSGIFNCGNVVGYAGTMFLNKKSPDKVVYDMGDIWQDNEGRTTTIIFGEIAIINAYIPNGNSRLDFKMKYLDALKKYIAQMKKSYKVICLGDFNIAHNEIDLTNPKECKNKSVFLPIERKALDEILSMGLVDSFRYCNPQKREYSWRSYRSMRDGFNGWKYRIDYILVDERLKENILSANIVDVRCSDHLPAVIELNI